MRYLVLAVCLCFATATQAMQSARNASSFYGGINLGVAIPSDADVAFSGQNSLGTLGGGGDISANAGFNISGVAGYKWAQGFRLEGDLSYRQNAFKSFAGSITLNNVEVLGSGATHGDISALNFMTNFWYDLDTGTGWIPYAGAGVGVARISADAKDESKTVQLVDDSDVVFAWQIGVGVGYEITTGVVLSANYRWLATANPQFKLDGGGTLESEYSSHSIVFGVRGHF